MRFTITVAIAAAFAVPATAAVIQPVAVVASDTFRTYNSINLINGSGLANDLHDTNWQNMWMSTSDPVPHFLVFDLGKTFSLESTDIWQYAANFNRPFSETGRGVKDLSISLSLDGVTFTPATDVVMERQILTEETKLTPFAAQSFALSGEARYVRFDLESNFGQPWTGLSEVRFNGVAVPAPAGLALMILGLGMLGGAVRRQRMLQA